MKRVLIVDDKAMMRDSVATTLNRAGFEPVAASDGQTALKMIARHRPAAVITDLKMPGMDGLTLLKQIVEMDPQLPVVLMTAYATIETAVDAMKHGAFDYIQKPFEGEQLLIAVKRAVQHRKLVTENEVLKNTQSAKSTDRPLIGESAIMRKLNAQIERIAETDSTVLISGESGTGKEIVARQIHQVSPRNDNVMLAVNCAALTSTLLESELFGHEKGAFTSADQLRKGRFELADGGTLLLDEISEITPALQAKLLRVLQERQFERVGSSVSMHTDVRVIATTNRSLQQAVRDGTFRSDLYFRLNVLPLHLPALRDRVEDIPLLAKHFFHLQSARMNGKLKQFDTDAIELLCQYTWPGNVRELQNLCERAAVLCQENTIPADMIRPWLAHNSLNHELNVASDAVEVEASETTDELIHVEPTEPMTLEEMERRIIVRTLNRYDGHRQRTAKALGIGVRTLGLKLKKWKQEQRVAATL